MIEFEFDSTPETDAMLKQLCVKECFVRCKDCKYWLPTTVESLKDGSYINQPNPCEINCFGNKGEWRTADDFCSRGERRDEID